MSPFFTKSVCNLLFASTIIPLNSFDILISQEGAMSFLITYNIYYQVIIVTFSYTFEHFPFSISDCKLVSSHPSSTLYRSQRPMNDKSQINEVLKLKNSM